MSQDSIPPAAGSEEVSVLSVSYLKYNFLMVGNLSSLLPADVDYLESQGCFQAPRRDLLDDIVQQYFLNMHTFLPIFHEGDFWSAYYHRGSLNPTIPQVPMLVFHAMMFISCNYASEETVKKLGFSNSREAKASFYRKAKLLYDFETETNPIYIAQAALILSFRASMDILSVKKATWLSIAIRHAETIGADNYVTLYPDSAPLSKEDAKTKNTLKRLWWGCIIRDRVLALCLRGGLQIGRAQSKLALSDPLTYLDQKDEFDHSNVYTPETKLYLARILEKFIHLCSVLTDVLSLIYPLNERLRGQGASDAEQKDIQKAETRLREWHKSTIISLRDLARLTPSNNPTSQNDPYNAVTLYTGVMNIFYYSARISLAQHQAFRLIGSPGVKTNLEQIREGLQIHVSASTQNFKKLREMGLDRWLTSSAVACIATPLLLQILDVKMLNHFSTSVDADIVAESHRRLNALFDNMNTYCSQFELVDFVVNVVRCVANSVHLGELQPILMNTVVYKWTDILTLNPEIYLRSVLILDLSLSRGRLPQEGEFSKFLAESMRGQNPYENFSENVASPSSFNHAVELSRTPFLPYITTFESISNCDIEPDLALFDETILNFDQAEGEGFGDIEVGNDAGARGDHSELFALADGNLRDEDPADDVFMGIMGPESESFMCDIIPSPL